MSFYSESKTSQKSFENGKVVNSSEEVIVNNNGDILVSVKGTPSKKVDINTITSTLMKPDHKKTLIERLSELSHSMEQVHTSGTTKSKTEKRKKKQPGSTLKKKKMKRGALQIGVNSRKKKRNNKNHNKNHNNMKSKKQRKK